MPICSTCGPRKIAPPSRARSRSRRAPMGRTLRRFGARRSRRALRALSAMTCWRVTRPAPERAIERARVLEAEQEADLGDRDRSIFEVTQREGVADLVEELVVGRPRFCEATLE